jgi:flagellar protein FlgJ
MSTISPVSGNEIHRQSLAATAAEPASQERDRLAVKKVARDFESMFVGMMFKSMRETVGKDSLTDGGHGEEIYRSMLDQEYAKASSEGRGIGLAGLIEKELLKTVHNAEKKSVASPNDTASALNERSAGMVYQALEFDYRRKP